MQTMNEQQQKKALTHSHNKIPIFDIQHIHITAAQCAWIEKLIARNEWECNGGKKIMLNKLKEKRQTSKAQEHF